MNLINQRNKYKDINVLVIEDNPDAQKLITLHLRHFGCTIFLRDFTQKLFLEELRSCDMVFISILPDRVGIRLLMQIQKKMNECGLPRKAKFIAYNTCGKAMAGECRNCRFDDVLEVSATLKDYQKLFEKFYPQN